MRQAKERWIMRSRPLKWRVVDERTTDMPSLQYIFNMWTISSDVNIPRRHWQSLSVHLWAYCTHATHDVNDVMCEGIIDQQHHHQEQNIKKLPRNTSVKVTEKLAKYKDLEIEIKWLWEIKAKQITEILGAHPTTKHQNTRTTENHSMSTSHILRKQGRNYGKN